MAKIKICGLRRTKDIRYVNELKPDYIGFILTPGFKRSITADTARTLKAALDTGIKSVGVFVDDDAGRINEYIAEGIIDLVQLHGKESPLYCAGINAPAIKYFEPDRLDKINDYDTAYFLFDSGTGTGKVFDWNRIPRTDKPFFLAGGLNPQNIPKAIAEINPYCIDVSSAVETDGVKDYNKIKQIMECVR